MDSTTLQRAARRCLDALIVLAAIFVAGYLILRLRIVVLPVVASLMATTVLRPVQQFLLHRGLRPALASAVTMLAFLAALTGAGFLVLAPVVREYSDVGTTVSESWDDIADWLVEGPLELDPDTVEDLREDLGDTFDSVVNADGLLADSASLLAEAFTGVILTLVITFFLVKDGDKMVRGLRRAIPPERQAAADRVGNVCWTTVRGYVHGAAALGLFEAIVIGGALTIVGAELAAPVAALTFIAAFIPFVGAIAAGILAVLVALTTVGVSAGITIAVVAVVVQQLDNELLAPVVYGRALRIHPLVVLIGVAVGGTLGGLTGAFLAVPFSAVAANIVADLFPDAEDDSDDDTEVAADTDLS